MELQFGFDEIKGARENGIVINKTEDGVNVVITGERGFISSEEHFDTSEEANYYVVQRLRFRKNRINDSQNER